MTTAAVRAASRSTIAPQNRQLSAVASIVSLQFGQSKMVGSAMAAPMLKPSDMIGLPTSPPKDLALSPGCVGNSREVYAARLREASRFREALFSRSQCAGDHFGRALIAPERRTHLHALDQRPHGCQHLLRNFDSL